MSCSSKNAKLSYIFKHHRVPQEVRWRLIKLLRKTWPHRVQVSRKPCASYGDSPEPLASLVSRSVSIWVGDSSDSPGTGWLESSNCISLYLTSNTGIRRWGRLACMLWSCINCSMKSCFAIKIITSSASSAVVIVTVIKKCVWSATISSGNNMYKTRGHTVTRQPTWTRPSLLKNFTIKFTTVTSNVG